MPINLDAFVARTNIGYQFDLTTAWTLDDGRIAATDGRIGVILDADTETTSVFPVAPVGRGKRPRIKDAVLMWREDVKRWHKLPNRTLLPCCGKPCPTCCVKFGRSKELASRYASKLDALPNCRWGQVDPSAHDEAILFKFTGGIGCVMPVVDEDDNAD